MSKKIFSALCFDFCVKNQTFLISAEIFEFSKNNVFWNKFIFESTTWLCLGTHLSPVVLVDQKTNILRCLLVRDLQTAFDILERQPGRVLSCTAVTQSKWQPPSKGMEFAPMPRSRIAPGPPGSAHFAHFSTLLLYGRRSKRPRKRSFQWEPKEKFLQPFWFGRVEQLFGRASAWTCCWLHTMDQSLRRLLPISSVAGQYCVCPGCCSQLSFRVCHQCCCLSLDCHCHQASA